MHEWPIIERRRIISIEVRFPTMYPWNTTSDLETNCNRVELTENTKRCIPNKGFHSTETSDFNSSSWHISAKDTGVIRKMSRHCALSLVVICSLTLRRANWESELVQPRDDGLGIVQVCCLAGRQWNPSFATTKWRWNTLDEWIISGWLWWVISVSRMKGLTTNQPLDKIDCEVQCHKAGFSLHQLE